MAKEFWILGLVKSGNELVQAGVFSGGYVLPKSDVLQPLFIHSNKDEAERVRKYFGDARLIEFWDELWQIAIDPSGMPSIVAFHNHDDEDGWGDDWGDGRGPETDW